MAQTAFNENRLLENWLLRDYWEPENACWVLLDAIRIEHTLYRLRSGKKVSAHMPLDIHSINTAYVKLQNSHKDLLGRWMASKHDYSFSDSFLWERDYCIKWGLSKGVDLPWLEWAIEKGYLPAEMSEAATETETSVEVEKTEEPDVTTPRFEYAPLTSSFGYFPALEEILKGAYDAGEEKPNPLRVFQLLSKQKPENVRFDVEMKTLKYINQEGEWARPVTLKAIRQAISRRTKKP